MSLVAFLHGYPPQWSMGGELSTHRTLREIPGSIVYTECDAPYEFEGVQVRPLRTATVSEMVADADGAGASVLLAHSTLSQKTVQAAKRLGIPSVLAVHAPPRFAADLRQAWSRATVKVYNTEAARRAWRDPRGWLLHPPAGTPMPELGPREHLTLTSSLLNKGAGRVLDLADRRPDKRFIIVRSPAHKTHGDPAFEEKAAERRNVKVVDRIHPNDMGRLWRETRILLVPSRYETYGLVALEAAWQGIPSIHVNTPDVLEGIGDAAYLLNGFTIDELDAAVTRVNEDYMGWAVRARQRAETLKLRTQQELAAFVAGIRQLQGSK